MSLIQKAATVTVLLFILAVAPAMLFAGATLSQLVNAIAAVLLIGTAGAAA